MSGYIQDYSISKIPYFGTFDFFGIPLFDPAALGWNGNKCYHPTVIIQYALACWERRDNGYIEDFLKCAKWVFENGAEGPNGAVVWYIPFPIRTPKIDAPWISALTQSQAISVLLRYNELKPNPELVNTARAAIVPMMCTIDEGGLLYIHGEDYFFEEAGSIHILNGCLTSIFGISEYLDYENDDEVASVVNKVVSTVEKWLSYYDTGYWSRYSKNLRFNLADLHYHHVHYAQLNTLGFKLGSDIFLEYARKWKQYSLSPRKVFRFQLSRFFSLNMMRVLTVFKLDNLKFRR